MNTDTTQTRSSKKLPGKLQRAVDSTDRAQWTMRPPADVKNLVAHAIKDLGHDKAFWISECIRASLGPKYGGKKTLAPSLIHKI